MYAKFYGLSTEPFSLSPDPRFCFRHPSFSRAKAYFEFAIHRGEGFVVVTGRPGTGKTTLIQDLVTDLRKSPLLVARIERTQLEADDLLRSVAYAFGLDARASDKATLLHDMEALLLKRTGPRNRAILIVDEAQNLPEDALEELRLITNLHDRLSPLVQIFLVGQEALRDRIRSPRLEQLHQRIVAAAHIEPLDAEQMRAYVEHRLLCVGWRGDPAIRGEALALIYGATEGIPRLVNKFCDRLLVHGSIEGTHLLAAEDAHVVVAELRSEFLSPLDLRAPERLLQSRVAVPVLADLVGASPSGPRMPVRPAGISGAATPADLPPKDALASDELRPPAVPEPQLAGLAREAPVATGRSSPAPGLVVPARDWTAEPSDSLGGLPAAPQPRPRRARRFRVATAWAAATGLLMLAGVATAWLLDPQGLRALIDPLRQLTPGLVSRWSTAPGTPAASPAGEPEPPAAIVPVPEQALIPVLPVPVATKAAPIPVNDPDWSEPELEDAAGPLFGEPARDEGALAAVGDLAAGPEAGEPRASPALGLDPVHPGPVSPPETEWDNLVVELEEPTDAHLAEPVPAESEPVPSRDLDSGATQWTDSPPADAAGPAGAGPPEPLAAASPPEAPLAVLGPSLPAPASDALSEPLVSAPADAPVTDAAPAAGDESEATRADAALDDLADELRALGLTVARAETSLRLDLVELVRFRVDVSTIPEEALGVLRELGRALAGHPGIRVRVIGHTDRTGPSEYNRALSEQRAVAVVDQLVGAGLDPSRVIAEGRGMDEPMHSVDGQSVHVRRIEVQVEALGGAPGPRAAQNSDRAP